MSGSFWKFSNGFTLLSNVSTLLEQYNATKDDAQLSATETVDAVLLKLLDESDLLQELLSNNSMLLEFLRDETVLQSLVGLVVREGRLELDVLPSASEASEATASENKATASENKASDASKASDETNASDETKASDETNASDETKASDSIEARDGSGDDDFDASDASDDATASGSPESGAAASSAGDATDSEPEDDTRETDEERRIRHATLAAEILAADVWSLTDTVMDSTALLNTLWGILDTPTPLSINLSTYFMKIMEHLLDMKCDEMIAYLIDNQPDLVHKFMNHLCNPPLMDFLLKLISTDKPDNLTGIIDFLQQQRLISRLIEALDTAETTQAHQGDPAVSVELTASASGDVLLRQSSAADFLKALITISANLTTDNSSIGPNELTRELVSYEQMHNLCLIMLKGDYALANGVGIIIEIIRKNNLDYDLLPVLYITLESHPPTGRDPIYLGHLLKVFSDHVDDFNRLLLRSAGSSAGTTGSLHQPKDGKLRTPFGEIEPLGFERFKICELVAELLHCSNMALLNDNKGYDMVKERDEMRLKMKEFDPISFKYNEVIVLPDNYAKKGEGSDEGDGADISDKVKQLLVNEPDANDTVDSFNKDDKVSGDEEEETHANANLTEEQIRAKPVVGDLLKILLYDTQIISNILEMFFRFPWNNFLHNVVFDIVQQVLNGSMDIGFNKFLAMDLFDRGDITNKIIGGQRDCTEYEKAHNGLRLGYMGHLTLIAEEVVKFIQLYPANSLSELIDVKVENEVWEEYVSHVLYDTREKYNAILGGGEDDEEDEDEEASNTFDEGVGEILEDDHSTLSRMIFDPAVDNDLRGSGYEDGFNDQQHEEDVGERAVGSPGKPVSSSSDESESEEDDDHFSNYMSLQLSNPEPKLPLPTTKISDDEDEESSEEESEFIRGKGSSPGADTFAADDDYIDPNDDGLLYKKKAHPLYDANGHLINVGEDEDNLSQDSSSSSSLDEEDEDLDGKDTGTELTRASSKS